MRFFLLLCSALLLGSGVSAQDRGQPVDGFAAEVDGRIITVGDVIERIRPGLLSLKRQYQGEELLKEQTELFRDGLDGLIEQQLMQAKFRQLGAELPAGIVQERADTLMRERFQNNRTQFLQTLERAGKTEAEWKEELKEQLVSQSMIQQFVRSKVHVAPREVRAEYEARRGELSEPVELKLRAIAFRPAAKGQEEARSRKIREVRERLEQGEDFAEVAKAFSEGPMAGRGGDQGWVKVDGLRGQLPDTLRDLRPGDRTDLVDTPSQSYIFQVEGRRGGGAMSLAEAQPFLEEQIRERKYDEEYQRWVEGLADEFQVQRFNPDISAVTGDL